MDRPVTSDTFTFEFEGHTVVLKELTFGEYDSFLSTLDNQVDRSTLKTVYGRIRAFINHNIDTILPYIISIDGDAEVKKYMHALPKSQTKNLIDRITAELVLSEDHSKNSLSSLEQSTVASAGSVETPVETGLGSASTNQV